MVRITPLDDPTVVIKHNKLIWLLVGCWLAAAFVSVAQADFADGVAAYNQGDYDTAFKKWKPLAEQGHASAQIKLGWMYENGRGIPQDYKEAVNWYRKAADQGDAEAQFNLGLMYYNGQGGPQDYVLAHMWFNLVAATQGHEYGIENRALVAEKMTNERIAEAQKLAREWKPKG